MFTEHLAGVHFRLLEDKLVDSASPSRSKPKGFPDWEHPCYDLFFYKASLQMHFPVDHALSNFYPFFLLYMSWMILWLIMFEDTPDETSKDYYIGAAEED